jgi:hypothetical protein
MTEEKSPAVGIFDQAPNNASPSARGETVTHDRTPYYAGAIIGLPGAILVLLGAVALNVFDLAAGDKPHGIWLFVAAYPLFALGAHCLDRIGEFKKEENRRRTGFNGQRTVND